MSEVQADTQPAPEQPPHIVRPTAAEGARPFVLRVLWHPRMRLFFKISLALGLLIWMVLSGKLDLKDLADRSKDWAWIAFAGVVLLPCYLLASLRFKVLLDGLDMPCSFGRALTWTMIGSFFNVALPSATGGDVVKVVYVTGAYPREKRAMAVLSVLVDRVVGLLGLFLLAFTVSVVVSEEGHGQMHGLVSLVRWLCLAAVLCFGLLTSKRLESSALRQRWFEALPLGSKLEKLYMGFAGLRTRPKLMLAVLLLSMFNHSLLITSYLVLAHGLHLPIHAPASLIVLPMLFFSRTFGFAGGFGTGEAAAGAVAPLMGLAAGDGCLLMFGFNLVCFAVSLLGLPFYLFGGPAVQRGKIKDPENDA